MVSSAEIFTLRRHTPDPARVRFAMAALFLLGANAGLIGALLPVWSGHFMLDSAAAGRLLLAGGLGAIAGGFGLSRADPRGRGLRLAIGASGLLTAACLLALSYVYEPAIVPIPAALLGAGIGGAVVAAIRALEGALTAQRSAALLHLAGVAFGAGAVTGCLLSFTLELWFRLPVLLRLTALLPAIVAMVAWRSRWFDFADSVVRTRRRYWRDAWNPTGVLLAIALFFQAWIYGVLGCWLALYLNRKFGLTVSMSVAALTCFWLSMIAGRVAAVRLPPIERRPRSLLAVSGLCLLGCLFLLKTVDASGAIVGACLVGFGCGALHPLTLETVQSHWSHRNPSLLTVYFVMTLAGGMALAWLVGPLSSAMGVDAVILTALGAGIATLLALLVIVVEVRLGARASAAD